MEGKTINMPATPLQRQGVCICCGIPLDRGRRRYCSRKCREDFLFKLSWFNNLLRALSARYATFFFTEEILSLNVLPFDSEDVITFFFPRKKGHKPVHDMEKMVFYLGEMWWSLLKEKGNRHAAARGVLTRGSRHIFSIKTLSPRIYRGIRGVGRELMYLKINRLELMGAMDPYLLVKQAYKRCALECHPDMGGDEKRFVELYNSYQRIIEWLKSPSFYHRRGIPGHWFFESGREHWYSPL